jgi:hypothetical protein
LFENIVGVKEEKKFGEGRHVEMFLGSEFMQVSGQSFMLHYMFPCSVDASILLLVRRLFYGEPAYDKEHADNPSKARSSPASGFPE